MTDIIVKGLVKAFEEDKNILDGLSFEITAGEKVGILGENGAGKTTLFRIFSGELGFDEGELHFAPGKRLGLVSQIPAYPPDFTAREVLKTAHERFSRMAGEMARLEAQMSQDSPAPVLREYDRLRADFLRLGGYEADTELSRVANGLAISPEMLELPFNALSGGEQTRVNLARLILEDTDILLLDEPTNHLDIKSAEWLENYLSRFKGTALIISHDRYFLDRAVTRIIEIVRGRAQLYSGNYSFYAAEKARRREEQAAKYEKEQSEAKRLLESAERLAGWGTGNRRLMKKSSAMKTRAARMVRTERPAGETRLRGRFGERDFFGDEILLIESLSKSFNGKRLFSIPGLRVEGGERIALVGENGAGKTTLLSLITGLLPPNDGFVRLGPSVRMAYLPQIVAFEYPERSVLDTVLYETNCSAAKARNMLGAFKFRGEEVFRLVGALSGGEKSRLRLCLLMSGSINLLILDEPTNHLDLQSREWIEEAVEDFDGALIFVSHDRYFINLFADRIWELENGTVTDFRGGFEAFREFKEKNAARLNLVKNDARRRETVKKHRASPEKTLAKAEREIEACERRLAQLDALAAQHGSDYQKLMELHAEREAAESELLSLYESWETLTEQS